MLNKPGIIKVPGAFDVWSAKLVELAGFPCCIYDRLWSFC